MNRTIYTFYCCICHQWQTAKKPLQCKLQNKQMLSIYCPTCQQQVPISNTNLSPQRYKIYFEREWKIIDQDSRIPYIVFFTNNKELATTVCTCLNEGKTLPFLQKNIYSINQLWTWAFSNDYY